MTKGIKLLIIVAVVIAVIAIAGFVVIKFVAPNFILDGPGMAYSFRDYELVGDWVQVDTDEPAKMTINKNTIKYKGIGGENGTVSYDVDDYSPFGEETNRIKFTDGKAPFEYFIYHKETVNGIEIGIISGIFVELDGRGPVVFDEYVKEKYASIVPADFTSSFADSCNNREAQPTYIEVEE